MGNISPSGDRSNVQSLQTTRRGRELASTPFPQRRRIRTRQQFQLNEPTPARGQALPSYHRRGATPRRYQETTFGDEEFLSTAHRRNVTPPRRYLETTFGDEEFPSTALRRNVTPPRRYLETTFGDEEIPSTSHRRIVTPPRRYLETTFGDEEIPSTSHRRNVTPPRRYMETAFDDEQIPSSPSERRNVIVRAPLAESESSGSDLCLEDLEIPTRDTSNFHEFHQELLETHRPPVGPGRFHEEILRRQLIHQVHADTRAANRNNGLNIHREVFSDDDPLPFAGNF